MRRSHPPTLLTLARRSIQADELFGKGARVLVAVSGGPDSMALLHVLARLRSKLGHELVAHGVDHGLRQEAAGELDLAAGLSHALDVPFGRSCLSVARGGNLQERARTARYDALRRAAREAGAVVIATAHHADDRAETVLLRLLRGAGPRGLAVLPPASGDLVRPLLRARRRDIEMHLRRHAIPFASDPSNQDPRFLRTRVRGELLPRLEELSPSIVTHLCALADQLDALIRGAPTVSMAGAPHMRTLPRATQEALAALARTASKKARVRLPGGLVATYDPGKLAVAVAEAKEGSHFRGQSGGRTRDSMVRIIKG